MIKLISSKSFGADSEVQYTWRYGEYSGSFEEALKYHTSWRNVGEFEHHVLRNPFANLMINNLYLFKVRDRYIMYNPAYKDASAFSELESIDEFIEKSAPDGVINQMDMGRSGSDVRPDRLYFEEYPDEVPPEFAMLYRPDDSYKNPRPEYASRYRREEARVLRTGNKWAAENFYDTHGRR